MWSRYLRTREQNGTVAVFHELHPYPIYIAKQDWLAYQSGEAIPVTLKATLQQHYLIVDSVNMDDDQFLLAEQRLLQKLQHVVILYLMTAQGCNLNCGYCQVQNLAKKYGESLLSFESAKAGIDLWNNHIGEIYDQSRDYNVIFYGGEPLLNKSVIVQSLRYLDDLKSLGTLPQNVQYMTATNGINVDQDFVNLCLRHNMSVAVGLDGNASTNDALKVDLQGNPTFNKIISAIKLLTSSGVTTFASCSITPFNLDQIDQMSLFFKEIGVKKFGFNFLRGQKLVDLIGESNIEDYYHKASRAVIRNTKLQTEPRFEYQMEKKILVYKQGDFFPLDCTCYGSQLVIQPDGQISNCPFYKAQLGNVQTVGSDFRIKDQPIVHAWRKQLPLYHSGDAKALSGGGCTWGMIDRGLYPTTTDIGSLIFAEEVLDDFIWSNHES